MRGKNQDGRRRVYLICVIKYQCAVHSEKTSITCIMLSNETFDSMVEMYAIALAEHEQGPFIYFHLCCPWVKRFHVGLTEVFFQNIRVLQESSEYLWILAHVIHSRKMDTCVLFLITSDNNNNNKNNNKSNYIAPDQSRLLSGALHT